MICRYEEMAKRLKTLTGSTNKCETDVVEEEADESGDQYWAERILDWGFHNNGVMMYLVKWEGYSDEQNSWEVQKNVKGCDELLADFTINNMNSRHPPKWSFEEFDKILKCLLNVLQTDDRAVLRKLSKRTIDCFEIRNPEVINELRNLVKSQINILLERKKCCQSRSNLERNKTRDVTLKVIQSLYILRNFDSITNFFEFVDSRNEILQNLIEWEIMQNKVIEKGGEGRPLRIVNDVDLEIPQLDSYITDYIIDKQFGNEINLEEETPLVGCDCVDCYNCRHDCCTAIVGFPMVYNKDGLMNTTRFKTLIYECNSKCKCDDKCSNRQIQKGRQFDLEIFRSDSKTRGWGVRTLQLIPKGSFITHYTGEVISIIEAEKRPSTYLFDLSAHLHPDDAEYTYVVDASRYGNITRFVNHSCEPNCRILFAWIKRSSDRLLPMIVLFSEIDIKPYEELTYDYSMDTSGTWNGVNAPIDNTSTTRVTRKVKSYKKIKCECGAQKCTNFLYS
ncbi:histone-lysine N-methyltransferase SUV39H2-like [Oppia nitens]|uniref:histone-lysine N-methyltransferase SUV39H2-like n=1 Tax=Oppia nitens TaxID=1686743 RepID=UPI0023DB79BC|nr:histone-lysine N-methyltransferase SUV39H2-like [Oppia nitens]